MISQITFKFISTALLATLVTIVVTLTVFSTNSGADPITREEAQEFINRVRSIEGWPRDFDARAEAYRMLRRAQAKFRADPQSSIALRNLGEAHHFLGHFAEHDHDYPRARRHHVKSIDFFIRSGHHSRHSDLPGDLHAKEHIFMDLYDEGILMSRQSNERKAEELFNQAWDYLNAYGLANQISSDRFVVRYEPLHLRITGKPIDFSSVSIPLSLGSGGPVFLLPTDCELVLMRQFVRSMLIHRR